MANKKTKKSKLSQRTPPLQSSGEQIHPIVYQGDCITVYALNSNLICSEQDSGAPTELTASCELKKTGKCPVTNVKDCKAFYYKDVSVKDFIDRLSEGDDAKLKAIFAMLDLKKGQYSNVEKFKHISGLNSNGQTFYEVKSYKIRIGGFWQDGYRLYLTNAWIKKSPKADPKELSKIKKIYEEFIKL